MNGMLDLVISCDKEICKRDGEREITKLERKRERARWTKDIYKEKREKARKVNEIKEKTNQRLNGRLDVAISCAEVREREGKRDRRDIGEVKREQIE